MNAGLQQILHRNPGQITSISNRFGGPERGPPSN
jgi:hypothetical protein